MKNIIKITSTVLILLILASCTPAAEPTGTGATSDPTSTITDATPDPTPTNTGTVGEELRDVPDYEADRDLYYKTLVTTENLIWGDMYYVFIWYWYHWTGNEIYHNEPNLNDTESIYNDDMVRKFIDYIYDTDYAINEIYKKPDSDGTYKLTDEEKDELVSAFLNTLSDLFPRDIFEYIPRPIVKEIISTYHYCGDDLIAAGMLDIIYEALENTTDEDYVISNFTEYCYERFAEIDKIDRKNSIEKDFHAALVEHINNKYAIYDSEVQLYALGLNRHSELLETIFGISTQEFMKLPEHQRDRYMQVLSERIYAHVSIPELVYAYGITKGEFDQVFFNFWYRDNHYNREDIHTYRYDIMVEDRAIIEEMISNATSPQDVYKLNAYIRDTQK